MIHLIALALGFVWADLPVEPVTYPKHIEFKRALEVEDPPISSKPLIMTSVQFDHVDANLPDLRMSDAETGFNRAVGKIVKTAVDAIPNACVTLRANLDQPLAIDGPSGQRRLVGAMATKILSRSGIAPAREIPEGARVSHVAIDRLGFELRSTFDFPVGQPQLHRDLVHVDSRQVGVVIGRDRVDLDVKLSPNTRAALVAGLRRVIGTQDPARLDPRIYVHLLDLNKNNFGAFALDAKLNEELTREALDRPPGLLSQCADFFERSF